MLTERQLETALDEVGAWIRENRKTAGVLIEIKEPHMVRTATLAKRILRDSKTEQPLAELIAAVHDIAFYVTDVEQGHAQVGYEILRDGLLDRVLDKVYGDGSVGEKLAEREIILEAVLKHADLTVDYDQMDPRMALHVKVIRDADMIDSLDSKLRRIPMVDLLAVKGFSMEDLRTSKVNGPVCLRFLQNETINYRLCKTPADWIVAWNAYLFGLKIPNSVRIARDVLDGVDFFPQEYVDDPSTKVQFREMNRAITLYLEYM